MLWTAIKIQLKNESSYQVVYKYCTTTKRRADARLYKIKEKKLPGCKATLYNNKIKVKQWNA